MRRISFIIAVAFCLLIGGIAFGQEFAENEIMVKFKAGVGEANIIALNQQNGTSVIDSIPSLRLRRLSLPKEKKVMEMVAIYSAAPIVEYAEPNYIVRIYVTHPNDPRYSEQWALNNTGLTGGTPDADIDAPEAWDIQTGSDDVVVAVIDTGVDLDHVDLGHPGTTPSNIWKNPGETKDGIDNDGNGYVDDIVGWDFCTIPPHVPGNNPDDDNGHGTHCSGIIGALGDNGIGVAGTNWKVKIMALKFLNASGWGYNSDAVKALDYATMMKRDYGIPVVTTSNSWGSSAPVHIQSLEDAIIEANNNGILFVAAAGNDNEDTDINPHYPSCYPEENVISVAATDHNDYKSYVPGVWGSNWGKTTVDLGAPGSSILSTLPGDTYASWSGTSMATPYVSGVTALLRSEFPGMSHIDIKERILATTDFIHPLSWTNSTNKGQVLTGGRLNAYNALIGPPSSTEIEIITNKYTYAAGNRMLVHVRLFNLDAPLPVRVLIELKKPDGSIIPSFTKDVSFTLAHGFIVKTAYDITIPGGAPTGVYTWIARLYDSANILLSEDEAKFEIPTSTLASEATVGEFSLHQNSPNPFNPETWIPYQLGGKANVSIRIYDVTGQLIRILDLGQREAGEYLSKDKAAYWDGRNREGEQVASGVYFYQIQAGDFTATKKMLLLK